MKIDKRIFLILIYAAIVSCSAQKPLTRSIESLIPVDQLHEDLGVLKSSIESIHAGLYTYTSKEEMDARFLELKSAIIKPMTSVDFYRLVLPLHNKIRNGHTFIIPPESWSQAVETTLLHFPFDVYRDGERLYILRNLSKNTDIFPADELISINGKNAMEVYETLVDSWTKDGYNTTFPEKIVHQDFSEFYANVLGCPVMFEVSIKQKDEIKYFQIDGLPISTMREHSKERYQYDKRPWYNDNKSISMGLEIKDDVAILTVPTFSIDAIKDLNINYQKFFKATFAEINKKNIQDLVIDIRGNGGGHGDVAIELFSYLHDKPFKLLKEMYAITNKIGPKEYYQGNISSVNLQMKVGLKKVAEQKYVPKASAAKKNHLSLDEKLPSEPHYGGRLYVLADGWSFSASGMFTSLVKNYDRAVFIGEEVGSNPHTQVGDFEQMLVLPYSGVRVRIPLLVQYMDVDFENTGHGVIPEHFVRNSIQQELSKEDSVLNWTLDFINNRIEE